MTQQYPGEPPRQQPFTRHYGQPPQAPPPQAPWPPYGQQQPYGQQPPPQGQWPQYQPPQPPGPPPRRRRRHRGLRAFAFSMLGLLVIVIAIVATQHGNGQSPAPPAVPTSAPPAAAAASSAAAASVRAHTVATFTGSGQSNTPRFTVTATWKLVYSFNCSAFGQSGNFQVYEDGGSDLNGVSVNDLAMSKSASTWAYGDAGTHFLQVNSECAWKMRVVDEP